MGQLVATWLQDADSFDGVHFHVWIHQEGPGRAQVNPAVNIGQAYLVLPPGPRHPKMSMLHNTIV